ncbi:MAG TPA: 2-amino-4-hydroxy-6-hydroxymethyldihydropteridine diphosphokinase [Symbiobacteriaceae bacterium]|jgi:dihydroneopterin aldolase/2-amino-4-hydroxy-6-hydroxymethyldihydropteridine diphosphokinase
MSDRIVLSGMRFFGYHGVLPEENRLGQTFFVDVELYAGLQAAGAADDLRETINYAEVYALTKEILEGPSLKLIEAVAERVAQAVLKAHPVSAIVVRVHKPGAPIPGHFDDVTVEIRRRRLAYLSLGSNLGDRLEYLAEAARLLEDDHVRVVRVSSVCETVPQGKTDQPMYLNVGAAVETDLAPHDLLRRLQQVERTLGRVRSERWGPRTVDIDLILYGPAVIRTDDLVVPHPRVAERAFVLIPLLEIDPTLMFPGGEESLQAALARLPDQGVVSSLPAEAFLQRVRGVQ